MALVFSVEDKRGAQHPKRTPFSIHRCWLLTTSLLRTRKMELSGRGREKPCHIEPAPFWQAVMQSSFVKDRVVSHKKDLWTNDSSEKGEKNGKTNRQPFSAVKKIERGELRQTHILCKGSAGWTVVALTQMLACQAITASICRSLFSNSSWWLFQSAGWVWKHRLFQLEITEGSIYGR